MSTSSTSHSLDSIQIWRVRSLVESFCLYVDDDNVSRCDHDVKFLGFRVLSLHYRMSGEASRDQASSPGGNAVEWPG